MTSMLTEIQKSFDDPPSKPSNKPSNPPPSTTDAIYPGIPLTRLEIQKMISDELNIPVVLREDGSSAVDCPFCNDIHQHPDAEGRVVPDCASDNNETILHFGDRSFNCRYGYIVYPYKMHEGKYVIKELN